jgi:tetratricopeptide (TPR) repeat protein
MRQRWMWMALATGLLALGARSIEGGMPPRAGETRAAAAADTIPDARLLAARGREFEARGQLDSAYAYYGQALEMDDSSHGVAMDRLLASSPLLQQRRSLPAEVLFVREVRGLLAATPAGATRAAEIGSAEEAMAALEGLLAHREAVIEVRYPTSGFQVSYRRWLYRNDPAVLWAPLASDTTVRVQAAAYQFRFRLPGADRDTTLTLPCANGCRVPPGS